MFVNKRVRSVTKFARRHSLGLHVGNFLQFECAFASNGVVHATAEKQECFCGAKLLGESRGRRVPCGKGLLDGVWNSSKTREIFPCGVLGDLTTLASEIKSEEVEQRQLRGEALSRRHGFFGTGEGLERCAGFPRNRGAGDV